MNIHMARWQSKIEQATLTFWSGVVFCFWVVIGLVWLFEFCINWLQDERQLPVKNLVVEGQGRYVNYTDVETALTELRKESFFLLDVNEARKRIEDLPWVLQASVRKQWPDILKIYVTEQQPVAHWNNKALLNEDVAIFDADKDSHSHIPEQGKGSLGVIDETLNRKIRSLLLKKLNR